MKQISLKHAIARGFTLIELMVVLVILGILAVLVVPNVLDRADDARTTAAKTDIANLTQALKLYKLDNQRYPTAEQGLQALIARPPYRLRGGRIWTSSRKTHGASLTSTSILASKAKLT
jgi:general secretion pathway protein G